MPRNLKRYQHQGCFHFITFSCYGRMKFLGSARARAVFEAELDRVRRWYGLCIAGYVVMPEHVHLLVSEPERGELSVVIQMLKQITSRKLRRPDSAHFWQARYYDFPVWSEKKRVEKLRYLHRNPVKRGLVARPEDWKWSSFRQWATGCAGTVEIECHWTAREREKMGLIPKLTLPSDLPRPSSKPGERVGQPRAVHDAAAAVVCSSAA